MTGAGPAPYTVEQLVERLSAGEDPRSIARSRLTPEERELLRRCAAVRSFDQALFDEVITAGLGTAGPGATEAGGGHGFTIEGLVSAGHAEPVPGSAGRWRLRARVRADWYEAWWPEAEAGAAGRQGRQGTDEIPAELRAFTDGLLRHYRAAGDQVELVYHLALVDQPAAQVLFRRLFDDADRRFDLAGCQDLLDALSAPERDRHLGVDLAELRNDRQRYLRARSHWSPEWYQSARFLERPRLHALLTGLLDGTIEGRPARALQLHARGGMGKTMQLRWFIARWCMPAPRRIPCARVDFDLADPANASTHPWLVLLELADQLDRQLPGEPFAELLAEHGRLRALLGRLPTEAAQAAASVVGDPERAAALAEEVEFRFTSTLSSLMAGGAGEPPGQGDDQGDDQGDGQAGSQAGSQAGGQAGAGRPVVVVLDTLEEVLLHPAGDLRRLLELLARVLGACPALRLVLSGRYDLTDPDRLGPLDDLLPGLVSEAVTEFDERECRAYLTETRGITRPELVDALARKSRGLPFTLALLADLAAARPDLDPAEVEGYDDPGVLYLIERVVSRIDDPQVRWLLRYGVVPRRLSFEFVAEVMRPHLAKGMAGTSTVDDPEADHRPRRLAGQPFPTDALPAEDAPLDLEALWGRLRRYASASSWVSLHAEDPGTVVFHPDVVEPMRRVLRDHEVYRLLHREALRWYDRRLAREPEGWLGLAREAVYHAFQAEGPAAAGRWQELLNETERRGGLDWRGQLAAELLRPEYVDEAGNPRRWDAELPIVTWPLLAQANFEEARALVDAMGLPGGQVAAAHPLLGRAVRRLDRAREIQRAHGWPEAPEALLASLDVTLRGARGGAAGLTAADLDDLEARVDTASSPEERLAVLETLARTAVELGRPEAAIGYYRRMAEAAGALRGDEAGAWRQRAQRRLALLLAERDRLDEAVEASEAALALGQVGGEPYLMVLREAVGIRLAAGTPASVPAILAPIRTSPAAPVPGPAAAPPATSGSATSGPDGGGDAAGDGDEARDKARDELLVLTDCGARVYLATGQPHAANGVLLPDPVPGPMRLQPTDVERMELRGEIRAALMDTVAAHEDLEAAAAAWEARGETERACLALARAARAHLRGTGNLRQVARLLDRAGRLAPPPGTDAWLAVHLRRMELHAAQGEHQRARDTLDQVFRGLPRSGYPSRLRVLAALAGLALPPPSGRRGYLDPSEQDLLRVLGTHLERVRPWTARLRLLGGLRRCPPLGNPASELAEPLRRLVRDLDAAPAPAADIGRAERAMWQLTAAEVCRVLSRWDEAAALLTEAGRALSSARGKDGAFGCRLWVAAARRLGEDSPDEDGPDLDAACPPPRDSLDRAAEELRGQPGLAGAFLVDLAALRLDTDSMYVTHARLRRAEQLLEAGGHISAPYGTGTRWGAELRELQARVAERGGNKEGAATLHRAAAQFWDALGQRGRAEGARRAATATRAGTRAGDGAGTGTPRTARPPAPWTSAPTRPPVAPPRLDPTAAGGTATPPPSEPPASPGPSAPPGPLGGPATFPHPPPTVRDPGPDPQNRSRPPDPSRRDPGPWRRRLGWLRALAPRPRRPMRPPVLGPWLSRGTATLVWTGVALLAVALAAALSLELLGPSGEGIDPSATSQPTGATSPTSTTEPSSTARPTSTTGPQATNPGLWPDLPGPLDRPGVVAMVLLAAGLAAIAIRSVRRRLAGAAGDPPLDHAPTASRPALGKQPVPRGEPALPGPEIPPDVAGPRPGAPGTPPWQGPRQTGGRIAYQAPVGGRLPPGGWPARVFTEIHLAGDNLVTTGVATEPGAPPSLVPSRAAPPAALADPALLRRGDVLAFRRLLELLVTLPDEAASLLADHLLPGAARLPEGVTELWVGAEGTMLGMLPWELARRAGRLAGVRLQRWRGPLAPERELALVAWRALTRLGLAEPEAGSGAADPLEDPAFLAALAEFERRHGLKGEPRLGPATFAALRRAERATGGRDRDRLHVLLLPQYSGQVQSLSAGIDQAQQSGAFELWSFPMPHPAVEPAPILLDWFARQRDRGGLPVLYLAGRFVRTVSEVSLRPYRFPGERGSADGPAILASELDQLLTSLPEDVERPLVVVDAYLPASPNEAAMQLLLRNAFAHELFALGNAPAVVGLSVNAGSEREGREGTPRFLEALARGSSVVDAIEAARLGQEGGVWSGRGLPPVVAGGAGALWSQLPGYALPRLMVVDE